ncbi:30S ribosomal protein S4 [Candidatus Woesearchaeota archaeon]|jgi:small subunit ribosomal protein S4|nr:30S ribosomal protein S4 [Candidatus Woesearchaeota archaeon]MBT4595740.1 30S ribosomal protein S4 [Candidatus Woesearchaeota archaeon]MBT5741411.1 30S ribosomal protein S4 [Candidatus Woesearchaeota archaeon]MBT6505233.1 30S ribosomal protein S4 [Candidatus Woesearchaeota archaeon]MBT7296218.1 30S ribosomal protein S4 [Candidatus Woesearchaeota archaeon]
MGDPKKRKKTYQKPKHPWNKDRISSEHDLVKEFGLKNKKELWKMQAKLSSFKRQAKQLVIDNSNQGELEKNNLMGKVKRLGLLSETQNLVDILALTVRDILQRRLQSIIVKSGLSRTMKQSRQFIVHRHVSVNEIKVDVPSFLVSVTDEEKISFSPRSNLSDENHPERKIEIVVEEVEETEKESKSKNDEAKVEIKTETVKADSEVKSVEEVVKNE